ncbi:DNA-processing protein DprA [Laspinema olomoucense]|uniref:DNA-processing protein DprA n=1 Tax=Laspinema olomoucense TaxID=3231600 RepID=UPI0021BA8FA4|nr:DNA-processing protein DprA [Laspinema sp. D3c]MCT7995377.1 DNA-processing protein DprA [Laspinema sp. D3c]
MSTHILPADTQAILLLCGSFGQNRQTEPQPLTLSEYNQVAKWLLENQLKPADLLDNAGKTQLEKMPNSGKLTGDRLRGLLERGAMLAFAVEKWTNQGIWILARSDRLYPKRLKQQLKHSSPAILYGVGNQNLLDAGGLAVVGSRDLDEEGREYSQKVAETCAHQNIQIVSGGAKGVDSVVMLGAILSGGTALGILAHSLTQTAVSSQYRTAIREGKLTLVTAYDPESGFTVGNAMGRNKYIYAAADYALIVSSAVGEGGTWAGATEALKRLPNVPVFVRMQGNIPPGNRELIQQGAKPFPLSPWQGSLLELLQNTASPEEPIPVQEKTLDLDLNPTLVAVTSVFEKEKTSPVNPTPETPLNPPAMTRPQDIYHAVLPLIVEQLEQPKDEKSLAEVLEVQVGQLRQWLKKAVDEGKVIKKNKPVKYMINREATQLSLLEDC